MIDREILKITEYIEALAFEMKSPNIYTPRFVSLANEIRTAIHARLAQTERKWQWLTDDEIDAIDKSIPGATQVNLAKRLFAREIQAKLKEKNT